jgi:hypothetical protein
MNLSDFQFRSIENKLAQTSQSLYNISKDISKIAKNHERLTELLETLINLLKAE